MTLNIVPVLYINEYQYFVDKNPERKIDLEGGV